MTHLSLGDFRNYREAEVTLRPGLNLIIGRNGQGKTNLVEAISYFATLASHRVSSDAALIRAGADSAVARMKVAVGEREVLLEVQLNRSSRNRAQVNRNGVAPRELTRWFSSVVFAPEDLQLVRGDPAVRRRFLDEGVTLRQPAFAGVLSDYERVVKQRTALLKAARSGEGRKAIDSTLEVWNDRLVELGVTIMLARRDFVHSMLGPLSAAYESIVEQDHSPRMQLLETATGATRSEDVSRETPELEVVGCVAGSPARKDTEPRQMAIGDVSRETLTSQFRDSLAVVRVKELDRGVTLVGPHRDDLMFALNQLPVKGYASHGETWSYVLALRLAMAHVLRAESVAGDPVIVLDDVFAELDVRRRDALMCEVSKFEQVIVTAAVEGDVPVAAWNRTEILGGEVVAQSLIEPGVSFDLVPGTQVGGGADVQTAKPSNGEERQCSE